MLYAAVHTCEPSNTCNSNACVQERLKAQKAEAASNPEYGSTYKPQTSKEDRTAKRKQILSNIGVMSLLRQNALILLFKILCIQKHAFSVCMLCYDIVHCPALSIREMSINTCHAHSWQVLAESHDTVAFCHQHNKPIRSRNSKSCYSATRLALGCNKCTMHPTQGFVREDPRHVWQRGVSVVLLMETCWAVLCLTAFA